MLLLEHPRPYDADKAEYVVNAPLSACLMTGYITSFLESNGVKVDAIDANVSKWTIEQTIDRLENSTYSLICIRLVYLWTKTSEIFEMISQLRKRGICSHINLYGHYSTFAYKKILEQYHFIDSVTVGEPEQTILELSNHLINCKDGSLPIDIAGLMHRGVHGEPVLRELVNDLDSLPFPERRFLKNEIEAGIVTYILGSRGCYNNCGFCYLNPFYGKASSWRGRSAHNVFAEITELYNKYECIEFYFADANFFGQGRYGKERVVKLANLIVESGLQIKFGLECRANDVDEVGIALLVKAGLTNIFIGIESGNQATLNSINKNVSVEVNKKAVKTIKESGIKLNMGFIMFDKNADLNSIRQNFEFLQELGLLTEPYTTAHLLYHKQSMFEGTPDYERMVFRTGEAKGDQKFLDSDKYELLYEFNNKQVSAMADITTNYCSKALSIIFSNSVAYTDVAACENLDSPEDMFLVELNTLIIKFFDQTLSAIEEGIIGTQKADIAEIKRKHIEELDCLRNVPVC